MPRRFRRSKLFSFIGAACLVMLLVASPGCGGPGEGKVSGQVLFEGKPLPGGRILFRPADPRQNSASADIDASGNYQIVLPVGQVSLCVDNRELEPPPRFASIVPPNLSPEAQKAFANAAKAEARPPAANPEVQSSGRYVKIPDRYYLLEQSQLSFTVGPGEQRHNIELKK